MELVILYGHSNQQHTVYVLSGWAGIRTQDRSDGERCPH